MTHIIRSGCRVEIRSKRNKNLKIFPVETILIPFRPVEWTGHEWSGRITHAHTHASSVLALGSWNTLGFSCFGIRRRGRAPQRPVKLTLRSASSRSKTLWQLAFQWLGTTFVPAENSIPLPEMRVGLLLNRNARAAPGVATRRNLDARTTPRDAIFWRQISSSRWRHLSASQSLTHSLRRKSSTMSRSGGAICRQVEKLEVESCNLWRA